MSDIYINIKNKIREIRTAVMGVDVRNSIANAIELINEKTEDVNNGWQALLNAWIEVRDNDNLSFTEIIEARTDKNNIQHSSLKARLDANEDNTSTDKTITATHTFNKNSKTVAVNGEGLIAGVNKFNEEGATLNKLIVTELINLGDDSDNTWVQLDSNMSANVTNSSSWGSRIRKIDKIAYFDLRFTGITQANTIVATLPEGYRPSRIMYFWGTMGTTGGYPIRFSIDNTGVVTVLGTSAFTTSYNSSSLVVLSGSFIIAD